MYEGRSTHFWPSITQYYGFLDVRKMKLTGL